jgi:hypothetical protein
MVKIEIDFNFRINMGYRYAGYAEMFKFIELTD